MKDCIERFTSQVLQKKIPNIIHHKSGKDNYTYELESPEWEYFIVQLLSTPKTPETQRFIDETIDYCHDAPFAKKFSNQRFYSFDGRQFHVMKSIVGKSICEEDIDDPLIQKTAECLWKIHSSTINFPDSWKYKDLNNYKDIENIQKKAHSHIISSQENSIRDIFTSMNNILKEHKESSSLPTWVIHWDPAFKNFLIDPQQNITGLIDYDMISVEPLLWDLVDLIRSYLKIKGFDKNSFHLLIKSYNQSRKLTPEEESCLKDYCIIMILNTWFRYIISYFEDTNLLWDRNDSLQKAKRCLQEIHKLNSFF